MRVLVSSDRIGRLGPAEASDVIAAAFHTRGAAVAVAPVATGGDDLAEAIARFAPGARLARVTDVSDLPRLVASGVDHIDVTGMPTPDLAALEELPLVEVSNPPVVVVASEHAQAPLTGLHGAVAAVGRESGRDLGEVVAQETAAARWLERLGLTDAPGYGAHGGLGAWLARCGISADTGLGICIRGYGLADLMRRADLVVTGTDTLDFHHRGGEVVQGITRLAGEALSPVVVVSGRNFVSARELRLSGIEEAHAVRPGGDGTPVTPEDLAALAGRVAATWRW